MHMFICKHALQETRITDATSHQVHLTPYYGILLSADMVTHLLVLPLAA